jgi:mono/diheme cytochrome c family protein
MGESAGKYGSISAAALGASAGALAVVLWFAAWLWLGGTPPWTGRDSLERRIAVGAAALPAPPEGGPQRETAGFRQYAADCVRCHGEPGGAREAWAAGFDPAPPEFAITGTHRDVRQIFWILCHGEPGMPSFRAHHSDQALWNLALFVHDLPGPSAYATLKATWPPAPSSNGFADGATCYEGK